MSEDWGLDRFLEGLRRAASFTVRPGVVEITEYEGRALDPPVTLKVDDVSLRRYTAEAGEESQGAFGPSTPPDRAALQLLHIHVEELVLTRKVGQHTLVLTPDGLDWEA